MIKHLRKNKLYDILNLKYHKKDIELFLKEKESLGLIEYLSNNLFYLRKKPLSKSRYNCCYDKESLESNQIIPSKLYALKHLFWSNQSNSIPLDNYICKVIKANCYDYNSILYVYFGYQKVLEVYFRNFKESNEFFEEVFEL